MNRPGYLVVGVVLAGLIAAIADLASSPDPAPPTAVIPDKPPPVPVAGDLGRCRTITEPDAACAAAWDEKRRRFFGE